MRCRERGHASGARGCRHRAVAHPVLHALGLKPVSNGRAAFALGVVVGVRRLHIAPNAFLLGSGEFDSRVVEEGQIRLVRPDDGFLLHEPGASEDRVD